MAPAAVRALAAGALMIAAAFLPCPAPAQAQAEGGPGAVDLRVSEAEAKRIAARDPNAAEAAQRHETLIPTARRDDRGHWEVGFWAEGEEVVRVTVDRFGGEVRESWTGHQVAWRMARGYPGAFGRSLNAPWVWLPLCAIFVLGLLDWGRLRRIAHLDLLVVVAGFGLSHYFFNRGEIGLSVPLAYPPLLYLLARMLWVGCRGGPGLRPSLPATWLAIAALFLLSFRAGLNLADSNVIDVGYSGVIGAHLIAEGEPIYGNFPPEESHAGDTYGPVAYYAYVPFERAFPWRGEWDALPAAHAAAIFFDLAVAAGLFFLGMRLRRGGDAGFRLGALLAFAWAACPYAAFTLGSNSNDSLIAALLVGTLLLLASPPGRGAFLALASATKFAPLALAPLFATYRGREGPGPNRRRGRRSGGPGEQIDPGGERAAAGEVQRGKANSSRGWLRENARVAVPFALAFAATLALVMAQTLLDPGLSTFWERTVDFQAGRDSPFSIWGQTSLEALHTAVKVGAVGLGLLVALVPARKTVAQLAALGTAVLIAVQLTVEHWFYLYIPWFLPFLFVALLAGTARTRRT